MIKNVFQKDYIIYIERELYLNIHRSLINYNIVTYLVLYNQTLAE